MAAAKKQCFLHFLLFVSSPTIKDWGFTNDYKLCIIVNEY